MSVFVLDRLKEPHACEERRAVTRRALASVVAAGLLVLAASLGVVGRAGASGPTERIVQLLMHPADPEVMILRYGVASHGFLYSRDGGKTFRAMCSEAIAPELTGAERVDRLSLRQIHSTTPVAIDGEGRVYVALYGVTWVGDGTGCSWSRVPELDGKWAFGLRADPRDPNVLWAAVSENQESGSAPSKASLMRRDARGAWSVVSELMPLSGPEIVYDGDLLAAEHAGGTRLYVTMNVGGLAGYTQHMLVSDDEGRTFRRTRLPAELDSLALIAVDPIDPDRVLGALSVDSQPDRLLLSVDRGTTFRDYPGPTVRAVSGATFDEDGRMYLSDSGDASSAEAVGGLYTAARMGEPLTRIEGPEYLDCVQRDPRGGRMYLCSGDRFGVAAPETFAFEELVRLEKVEALIECPGRDMVSICQEQLNEGPSWCCAGHFPFTPMCGMYDVTQTASGRRVFCGRAGREYERPGSTTGMPAPAADGGSASRPYVSGDLPEGQLDVGDRASAGEGGGCAVAHASIGAGSWIGLLTVLGTLLAMVRRARPRR